MAAVARAPGGASEVEGVAMEERLVAAAARAAGGFGRHVAAAVTAAAVGTIVKFQKLGIAPDGLEDGGGRRECRFRARSSGRS